MNSISQSDPKAIAIIDSIKKGDLSQLKAYLDPIDSIKDFTIDEEIESQIVKRS